MTTRRRLGLLVKLLKLPKTFICHLHILEVGYLNHGVDLEILIHRAHQIIIILVIIIVIFTLVVGTLREVQLEADRGVLFQSVHI